jgi:hypothetical protein
VLAIAMQVILAPLLVAAATLAGRAWGERSAGVVSAFPAIVGPVLLVEAQTHGAAFAARAANGTLLGLAALAGFAVVYARAARRTGWRVSLAAGWAAAAAIAAIVAASGAGPLAGPPVAALSLVVAYRALPRNAAVHVPGPGRDLLPRMLVTCLLVLSLIAAADRFGPTVGGVLAALPTLASVLAVFTHRQGGAAAVSDLLRGMLHGMTGFVIFCVLVAMLLDRTAVAVAFALAALAAVAVQLVLRPRMGSAREDVVACR